MTTDDKALEAVEIALANLMSLTACRCGSNNKDIGFRSLTCVNDYRGDVETLRDRIHELEKKEMTLPEGRKPLTDEELTRITRGLLGHFEKDDNNDITKLIEDLKSENTRLRYVLEGVRAVVYQELEAKLAEVLKTLEFAAECLDDYSPITGNTIEAMISKIVRKKIIELRGEKESKANGSSD